MANVGMIFYDKEFIIFSSGVNVLKENIKRILMTRPGERVNNLTYGSRLQEYIFSNSGLAIEDILTEIKSSIERNDNRIIVDDVVLDKNENEVINISIYAHERTTKEVISVGIIV